MQGLGGNRCARAFRHTGKCFGCIEDHHHGHEFAAFDSEVDTAAFALLIECAGAELLGVKLAADCENSVPNDLGFKTPGRLPPVELIVPVDAGFVLMDGAVLLIDGTDRKSTRLNYSH